MSQGRVSRTSFGRRGVAAAPRRFEAAPARRASGGEEAGGFGFFSRQVTQDAPAPPSEHAAWSYFKACVTAFATAILLSGLIIDSNAPGTFTSRIFVNMASGVVMMTMAPIMLIPIRILSDVMRLIRIPRGVSDVLIGGLCGSLMMLPDLMDGQTPRALSIAFLAGGLFGGFVFWRARGYPGLDEKHRAKAEAAHAMLERGRKEL